MKRLLGTSLVATAIVTISGCNVYHYANPIPGENVVFRDNTTINNSGVNTVFGSYGGVVTNNNNVTTTSSDTPKDSYSNASMGQSASEYNDSIDSNNSVADSAVEQTQVEVSNSGEEAAESKEVSNHPDWIKKQAYDEIERGKQIFYGVGFSYYQAPTKKELDKAKEKATKTAVEKLTKYVLSTTQGVQEPLEGVIVNDEWQDNEQMTVYIRARFIIK